MIKRPHKNSIHSRIHKRLNKYRIFRHMQLNREFFLLLFFCGLFGILFIRLFWLQIIKHSYYDDLLNTQHVSKSLLKAERGHVYANDKSDHPIKLTENLTMYNLFVDPKFIWDKEKFIDIITPVVYKHLCELNGMEEVGHEGCIKNVGNFVNKDLLPETPDFFYYGSGRISDNWFLFDRTGYNMQYSGVKTNFNSGTAEKLIKQRLDEKIQIGIKDNNYIGFFSNPAFLEELKELKLPYVTIKYDNYVYITPNRVANISKDSQPIKKILNKYGYLDTLKGIERAFEPQENRYVKIIAEMNPYIAQIVKDLKIEYYKEQNNEKVPILHGLGLEDYTRRYYPYGSFLANVLGFVQKNGDALYGIEQYFGDLLKGKDGIIKGRSSAWIGQVGANEFEIEEVVDGSDVYLTIDIGMQKEVEAIAQTYKDYLKADSVSILVYDPYNGQIKASANAPSFDPNNYNDVFTMEPLGPDLSYIVDDETHIDIPVYIKTGGEYKLAKTYEREDQTLEKYIAKNIYGPQVMVDKNISMAYEPGSIFKALTVGIGVDSDETRFYDFYKDPGFVDVGPYTIENADNKHCMGEHSFLNALVYSCNVGMVRIAQSVGKESFYNYLDKLGFGVLTNIELANEDEGYIEGVTTVSLARYLNNTFGQGLLATPLQMAAGYGTLVNGGYYVKPTIVAGIYNPKEDTYYPNEKEVIRQVFRPETAEEIKHALFSVVEQNGDNVNNVRIEGYSLGGKSGTSQISFRGVYQDGLGWTNGSFVGLVTKEDPKYVVIVQVRRPRTSEWGGRTAGKVFREVAKFLISYAFIEE